jgi:hypothetical protein
MERNNFNIPIYINLIFVNIGNCIEKYTITANVILTDNIRWIGGQKFGISLYKDAKK